MSIETKSMSFWFSFEQYALVVGLFMIGTAFDLGSWQVIVAIAMLVGFAFRNTARPAVRFYTAITYRLAKENLGNRATWFIISSILGSVIGAIAIVMVIMFTMSHITSMVNGLIVAAVNSLFTILSDHGSVDVHSTTNTGNGLRSSS